MPALTTRAAVWRAPGEDLETVEFPLTDPTPGSVLVRITRCTICRSDLHTWRGRRPGPSPAILGHEAVGVVVRLGEGVSHDAADQPLAEGDRVTWTLHSCCGACRYCRELALPMKCVRLRKFGHGSCAEPPHLRGGFAEHCFVDRGTALLKLPDNLPDRVAAPANCAAATVTAGWESAGLATGQSVWVQGAGALGCYATAFAAFAGARRVVVTDIDPARLEAVRAFGATHCIDVRGLSDGEVVERVREVAPEGGLDSVLEVAGQPAALGPGLASLRAGGRFVEIGCSFPGAVATLDLSLLLRQRLSVVGVQNYDFRHLRRAVETLSLAQDRYPFDRVVGAEYPLERINEALRAADSGDAMRVAVVP